MPPCTLFASLRRPMSSSVELMLVHMFMPWRYRNEWSSSGVILLILLQTWPDGLWPKIITQCYSWLPGWVFKKCLLKCVPRHGESVVCRACDCQLPPTDVRVDPDLVGKRLKRSLTARIPLILTGSYRARSHSQNVTFQEFQLAVRFCRMLPPHDTLTALFRPRLSSSYSL